MPVTRRFSVVGFGFAVTSAALCTNAQRSVAHAQVEVAGEAGAPAPSSSAWRVAALSELQNWVTQNGGALSAEVLDLGSGKVARANHSAPLNPASNMKLITSAFALHKLGPTFTFRTALFGTIDPEGDIGKLVLRGDGDPTLTEADLWRLANTLRNRGVRRVGLLLVDQSAFDGQTVPPAFEQQPNEWASFRAPVSALAVERNSVTLNVLPQGENDPARVWFEPAGIVQTQGTIQTVARGRGQNVQLTLSQLPNGQLAANIGGHVAVGLSRQRFPKRVDDPSLVAGYVLARALRDVGVEVARVERGVVRDLPLLSYITSAPLDQLLAALGKHSDNFTAEMVFKSLSSAPNGVATFAASASLTEAWLRETAPMPQGSRVLNGSGLFDANRVSAETLVAVLRDAYFDPRRREAMLAQLSTGGVDGTLANRFTTPETKGRVRAKTGTLDESLALSGYVLRQGTKPPLVFSLIVNGVSGKHSEVRRHLDAVVTELAHLHP